MARKTVDEIIQKALGDAEFRTSLLDNPADALKHYDATLTTEERAALTSLREDPIALAGLLEKPEQAQPWWRAFVPDSFKEFGGSVLSLALILAFLIVLLATLGRVGSDPRSVMIGGAAQAVDEFARAKDLLTIILPLFGAVVTFWLGVAVESRRSEDQKEAAQQAHSAREEAQTRERRKTAVAAGALAQVEATVRSSGAPAGGPGTRSAPGEQHVEQRLREVEEVVANARRLIES